MQSQFIFYLKIVLVTWTLFVQDSSTSFRYDDESAQRAQCCGMRKLRELFRTPSQQTPDTFPGVASTYVNNNSIQH